MSPSGPKSVAARAQQDADRVRGLAIVEEIGKTVRTLIVCGTIFGVGYLILLGIEALAGKETQANILVSLLGKMEMSALLSWGAAGAGLIYGNSQRRLRKKTVERLQARNTHLEQMIDPHRSSSKLTPRGDTNPEDA